MPFHQRSVEPARLRRPEEAAVARAAGAPLFRSLEQVSSHTLVCLLAQLADLSRCAGDIFGELEGQAAALGHRTAELHRRLDALHAATAHLDHRRVKILHYDIEKHLSLARACYKNGEREGREGTFSSGSIFHVARGTFMKCKTRYERISFSVSYFCLSGTNKWNESRAMMRETELECSHDQHLFVLIQYHYIVFGILKMCG
ncbi:hypothetical protein STEG23_010690 [Scotinomys teguina]